MIAAIKKVVEMKVLFSYFRKRFPIFPLFIFSLLIFIGITIKSRLPLDCPKIILLSLVYTSFLFHLRLLDEFKDCDYDTKYHPDRPIQRGEISFKQIKILGAVNFAIMLGAALLTSTPTIIPLFLFVIFYSFLMYKEFFIRNFYKRAPTLYLASHQIVFIPLYVFFYSCLNTFPELLDNATGPALFFYTLIPIVLIEIGRKMRHRFDENGNKTDDTYAFVWGERNTIIVFSTLIILSGFFSLYIQGFIRALSLLILTSGIGLIFGSILFKEQILQNNMLLTAIFTLGLPALLLI